jgi:hypothetical protein
MSGVRFRHTQIRLADGRVLVAGGEGTSGPESPLTTAEVYDPATGLWTSTHSLNEAREDHSASLLPDGTVMVAGGYAGNYSVLASAEIYDPLTGTWRRVPGRGLQLARSSQTATTLPGGSALIAGGDYNTALAIAAELYRPQ